MGPAHSRALPSWSHMHGQHSEHVLAHEALVPFDSCSNEAARACCHATAWKARPHARAAGSPHEVGAAGPVGSCSLAWPSSRHTCTHLRACAMSGTHTQRCRLACFWGSPRGSARTHVVRLSLNMRLMGSLSSTSSHHGSTSISQLEEELLRKLQLSSAFRLLVCCGLCPYSLREREGRPCVRAACAQALHAHACARPRASACGAPAFPPSVSEQPDNRARAHAPEAWLSAWCIPQLCLVSPQLRLHQPTGKPYLYVICYMERPQRVHALCCARPQLCVCVFGAARACACCPGGGASFRA